MELITRTDISQLSIWRALPYQIARTLDLAQPKLLQIQSIWTTTLSPGQRDCPSAWMHWQAFFRSALRNFSTSRIATAPPSSNLHAALGLKMAYLQHRVNTQNNRVNSVRPPRNRPRNGRGGRRRGVRSQYWTSPALWAPRQTPPTRTITVASGGLAWRARTRRAFSFAKTGVSGPASAEVGHQKDGLRFRFWAA